MKVIFIKQLIFFFLIFAFSSLQGKGIDFTQKGMEKPPPRVIRTCCTFGNRVGVWGVPGLKITHISSLEELGPHHYLGDREEGNGLIYSAKGGFIDMGHVRDMADWTAYLYSYITHNLKNGKIPQKIIGYEGGIKQLSITAPSNISDNDIIKLAAKITYDLSMWHEIATWFGAGAIPLVPERYSSFSVEDPYSNMLGVKLGMEAIKSDLPFEEAMTSLIFQALDSLGAVETEQLTVDAIEKVRDIWWTDDKTLPHKNVLLHRQLNIFPRVIPSLVPGMEINSPLPVLEVPLVSSNNTSLDEYYQLEFKINYNFPVEELFPNRKVEWISSNDFEILIQRVAMDLELLAKENKKKNFPKHEITEKQAL